MIFRPTVALWIVLIFPVSAFSCAMQRIDEMEAITCGVGISLLEARNDAIRQGIQYLVGSYVTSDLESNNEQITRDNITDYSGAIADRFEVITQGQRSDGLYEITAHIGGVRDANRQRNRAPIQGSGLVDSQSLYAEAVSRIKKESDAHDLLENLFRGFPGKAFTFLVGQPKIDTIPDDSSHVRVSFFAATFWRDDFLAELKTLLESAGHLIGYNDKNPTDKQSAICLKSSFSEYPRLGDCYVIDVPKELVNKWLCRPGFGRPYIDAGININLGARHESSQDPYISEKIQIPYIERDTEYDAFIFYVVDKDSMVNNDKYLNGVTVKWDKTIIMRVEDLAAIGKVSARVTGC